MVAALIAVGWIVLVVTFFSWNPAVVYAGWAAAFVSFTAAGWVWLYRPGPTDRSAIHAGRIRRLGRWYRGLWMRAGANVAGWPHLIEAMFGTARAPVAQTPGEIVWEHGRASLKRYAGARTRGEPVLVVHALVTRPWILDLTPEVSLLKALADDGYDVFLLDWGDPGRHEGADGLAEYNATLLLAEEQVRAQTGAERLHLIAYCMGATLALARLGSRTHTHIGSFAAIAAPVDFAVPGGMQVVMSHRFMKPALMLDAKSCVPSSVVRESFHMLKPNAIQSVRRGIKARRDADAWAAYGALSRWVWEQRAMPGGLFFDLVDLFRSNAMFTGNLTLGAAQVDLSTIETPVLMALAERDHIVPGSSSHALQTLIDVDVLPCPSGHVSMLSGRGARAVLIPGLLAWLQKNTSAPPEELAEPAPAPRPKPRKTAKARAARSSSAKTTRKTSEKSPPKATPGGSRVARGSRGR